MRKHKVQIPVIGGVGETPVSISYGRTVGHSSGTTFDYHVNNSTGNDTTGTGTLANPYATPTKALAVAVAAGGNKKIALHLTATPYTDSPPTCTTSGIEFHGYDTDFVPWQGAYNVTGWTACVTGDSAVVGAAWTNCYKATFAKSNIAHTAYNALLPLENGTPLNLAQKRRDVTDLFFQDNTDTFYDNVKGDSVTMAVDGSGHPTTITHAAVLGAYTDAQIARCAVLIWGDANQSDYIPISSVSGGVITLAANSFLRQADGDGTHSAYNLLNIGPAIAQGQFCYDASDPTNITLYVWPNNAANLAAGILIAAKKNILTFQSCSNCKVSNIDFGLTANDDTSAVGAVVFDRTTSCEFKHNRIQYTSHRYRSGYGPLYIQGGTSNVIQNNDIKHAQNMFGPVLSNGAYTATGNRFLNNYIYRAALSPWRCLGQLLCAVVDNWSDGSGLGAHANKGNFYALSDQVVAWRNKWTNCGGYLTCQASSRMLFGMNYCPSDPTNTTAAGFIDQTGSVVPPTDPSSNFIINNLLPQSGANSGTGAGIDLTPVTTATVNWGVANNVTRYINDTPANRLTGYPDNNVTTTGSAIGANDTVVANRDDIFYDYTADDYNTIPGSILTTKSGKDVSAAVTQFETWFPDINFRTTVNGYSWDPADPGEGCYGKHWPVAVDVTAPTLSSLSATISGASASCTVSTNERGGTIYWVRYHTGSVPTGLQVVAGQDATGSAALSSGSLAVSGTGTQGPFTVTGTSGQTDTLAVVQRDRHGNISAVVTTSLAFAAFSPSWWSNDGTHKLNKASALTGFQASTKSMLCAFTVSRAAAQLTTQTTGGVVSAVGSSVNVPSYGMGSTSKMSIKQDDNADVPIVNQPAPGVSMVADVQYLFILGFTSDATNGFKFTSVCVRISDGVVIGTNQVTTGTDTSLVFSHNYALLQAAASYERIMLWDNAYRDPALTATQELFVAAGGGLLDPATAISSVGSPIISISDAALLTGVNAGSGGNFTWS